MCVFSEVRCRVLVISVMVIMVVVIEVLSMRSRMILIRLFNVLSMRWCVEVVVMGGDCVLNCENVRVVSVVRVRVMVS